MRYATQTEIGKVFNLDSHKISKILKSLGLKDEKNTPTNKSLDNELVEKRGKIWLWNKYEVIKILQKAGYKKAGKAAASEKNVKNIQKNTYIAFTDGSELSYAVVLFDPKNTKHLVAGKHSEKDSNRSELVAVRELLEILPKNKVITIITDSLHVKSVLGKKEPTINLDIVEPIRNLIKQKRLKVSCVWVKSHTGLHGNEEADALADFVKTLII